MQCADPWLRQKSDLHNLDIGVGADKTRQLMLLRETHEQERARDIEQKAPAKMIV